MLKQEQDMGNKVAVIKLHKDGGGDVWVTKEVQQTRHETQIEDTEDSMHSYIQVTGQQNEQETSSSSSSS